jgi:hypothetical protein
MRFYALASVRKLLPAMFAAAFLALASTTSPAQDEIPDAARLAFVSGAVSVQPSGVDNWGEAYPNLPLGPGDRIFSDSNGRAEIQIGQAFLRIGPNTDVTFVNADPAAITFGLAQGSMHLHVFGMSYGQVLLVNSPNGNATMQHEGDYRVEALPSEGATVFTAFGNGEWIKGAGGYRQFIEGGQVLELAGSNPVSPQWLQPGNPDDLDRWSQQRDVIYAHPVSFRYVNPGIAGAAELDASGDWQPESDYGPIWFPRGVAVGWAPYHNGHWVNHAPWGWIWVEDESWGYAPFHYGRWVSISGRWGWIPGPPAARPVWSPALVVFAGGVQFGGATVSAWFPLGPGEPYRPWYPCSPHYIDEVNISNIHESRVIHVQTTYVNIVNVTNITKITYVNRTIGVTAMSHDDLAAGHSAARVAVKIDVHQMDHVTPLERPVVQPTAASFVGRPPAHAVPVKAERPVLINSEGKMAAAKPNAQAVEAPVKAAPVVKPLAGHAVAAPPPGTKTPPPPARTGTLPPPREAAPATPAKPGEKPEPKEAAPVPPAPGAKPAVKPAPAAPGQPGAKPAPNGAQPAPAAPGTKPAAKPGTKPADKDKKPTDDPDKKPE